MKAGILAFSGKGESTTGRVAGFFAARGDEPEAARCASGGLAAWTKTHFHTDNALVFVGSCGIAVRAIAPYVDSKVSDPAVLVVDELGRYVIPLLSGHLGGANELARALASCLGATAVVTTATDLHGLFAVDTWAKKQGLIIVNPSGIQKVSSLLLSGEKVGVRSDFPVQGTLPEGLFFAEGPCEIRISCLSDMEPGALHLVPPILTLGVGCRRGTPKERLDRAFSALLQAARCHPAAVCRACSIDLKAEEPGLLAFCREQGLPLRCFSARELAGVPGDFSSSEFVASVTGVDNVCERSAMSGSGAGGRLWMGKTVLDGVTMALAAAPFAISFEM